MKKTIYVIRWVLLIFAALPVLWLFLVTSLNLYYLSKPYPAPNSLSWGTTFSAKYATGLGLDWQETYLAILDELKPKGLRLIAYWDQVEPQKEKWDFSALDWQVAEAQKRNIPFIISFGQKTPRWPECHIPPWVKSAGKEKRKTELLTYEKNVIQRYKSSKGLLYWQVENEPLVMLGNCPFPDEKLLAAEVLFTKMIDPKTPILVNDGERATIWHHAARYGDVLGLSLYRKISNKYFSYTLPQVPEFYSAKRTLTQLITHRPGEKYLFTEVGLEPWGPSFTTADFKNTVRFATETRFDTFYAWGAEWWYRQKLNGHSEYWDLGKKLFSNEKL